MDVQTVGRICGVCNYAYYDTVFVLSVFGSSVSKINGWRDVRPSGHNSRGGNEA